MTTKVDTQVSSVDDQLCVFLWALPRSLSTAVTKCMSFVDGVQVWYEPYLFSRQNEDMGNTDVTTRWGEQGLHLILPALAKEPRGKRLDNELFSFPWVKSQLEKQDTDEKIVFVKDMANAVHGKYEFLPTTGKFRHTFLIRDPIPMYNSLRKLLNKLRVDTAAHTSTEMPESDVLQQPDHTYKNTHDMWKYVKEHLDPNPIIIDSAELAAHPDKLLPKYFDAIGVPYKEEYLQWDSSPDVANQWKTSFQGFLFASVGGVHEKAMGSACFVPEGPIPPRNDLPADVIKCADAARPYYEEMFAHRIEP